MAKNYQRQNRPPVPSAVREAEIIKEFFTDEGVRVGLRPISQVLLTKAAEGVRKRFKEAGEPVEPPTYGVEVAGGGEKRFKLNEKILEVPGDPEESARRAAAWLDYTQALERMDAEIREISGQIVAGGLVVKLPEDDRWITRQRKWGIEIPEDPEDLLIHYIMTEIIKTPRDIARAQQYVMAVSSSGVVTREAIEAATSTFFRDVAGRGDSAIGELLNPGGNGNQSSTVQPLDTQSEPVNA